MAFDQNNIPKDLRPINVARINAEEGRIPNQARTAEGLYANPTRSDITSPPSVPVYLVPATSDCKIVGLNSGNPSPVIVQAQSVAVRGPCLPMAVGTQVTSQSLSISPSSCYQSLSLSVRTSNSSIDHMTDEVGEDPVSSKKVKFLCSFGGKILPRPSDGMLRYVGGQTRIITVRRDVTCSELVQKMADACGQQVLMKYQLPDEDLDALVSVSCPDDLENMMEEYEKLLERSPDGSVKLRVFLFSSSELDSSGLMQFGDLQDSSKKYVDAVNGVMEVVGGGGMARKESIASATSTQNSDMSVADANDTSLLGQDVTGPPSSNVPSPKTDNTTILEASGAPLAPGLSQPETSLEKTMPLPLQQPTLAYDLQQSVVKATAPMPYLHGLMDAPQVTISNTEYQKVASHLIYTNPAQVATPSRPLLLPSQCQDNVSTVVPQRFIPAVHMTMAPSSSNMSINPTMYPTFMQSPHLVTLPDQSYNAYQAQMPGGVPGYGWNQVLSPQEHVPLSMPYQKVIPSENVQRKEDCTTSHKQLPHAPHAHSDMVVQEQSSPTIPDVNTLLQGLCLDDIARLQPINKVVSPSQAELVGVSKGTEAQCESQRIVIDHPRNLSPQGVIGITGEVQAPYSVATSNVVQSSSYDAGQSLVLPLSCGRQEVLANKPVKCENVASGAPLVATDTLSREVRKEYPEIACGSEKSTLPTDQPPHKVVGEDLLLNNSFRKPTPNPEAIATQAMVSPNDLETVFANTNVQCPMDSSNLSGNTHESTSSVSSVYSNQDPWSFLQESHQPPPMPSKIATRKEASAPRDPFPGNLFSEDAESTSAQILDPVFHTCREDNSKQALSNKVLHDFIKQETQATKEEVTPSVLQVQLSLTSADLSVDLSDSDANDERELQNNIDAVLQAKVEGMNVKSEKANLALPLSDGLGRLQIIKNSDLEELRELGSGTFGTVYHGKWRGTDVAIKRINNRCFAGKPSEQERMIDDFWNEAIKLGGLHHPNVVAFYGVVLDGPGGSVATVTEYMVNGSLRTALQKNERALDKRKRLLISMDVAFGMEYLHSRNIVHFDLKSDNLLVNLRDPHRPICKVGDLGLSKVKCQTLISGGVRGTLPWMAPELLNGSSSLVSDKVDVFSFGIVMWELLTGEEPYTDLHYGAIIGGIVSNTLRPSVPDNCDPDWRSLMEKCWSPEPSERPSFTQITDELRAMAAKIPPKGQTSASTTKTNVQAI